MQREIRLTADGSHTIGFAGTKVSYHSHKGAIAESIHVFVDAGFNYLRRQVPREAVTILEIGFGTGLNALLTLKEAIAQQQNVRYISIETMPVTEAEYTHINHGEILQMKAFFQQLHQSPWEEDVPIDPRFILHKKNISLLDLFLNETVDCIYFDAFAPNDQPELWTEKVFANLFSVLSAGGILVTYSSNSNMRRAMQAAGFRVTKIPGALGKRDMVRAIKEK